MPKLYDVLAGLTQALVYQVGDKLILVMTPVYTKFCDR